MVRCILLGIAAVEVGPMDFAVVDVGQDSHCSWHSISDLVLVVVAVAGYRVGFLAKGRQPTGCWMSWFCAEKT